MNSKKRTKKQLKALKQGREGGFGGRTVFLKYGVEHMRTIGRNGGKKNKKAVLVR